MIGVYYAGFPFGGQSGGTVFTSVLIIDDALHGHAVEVFALTQQHILAVADALHAQLTDAAFISLHVPLDIQDALHGQEADGNLTISVLYRETPQGPLLKLTLPIGKVDTQNPAAGTDNPRVTVTATREQILQAIQTEKPVGSVQVEKLTAFPKGEPLVVLSKKELVEPGPKTDLTPIPLIANDKPTAKI